MLSVGAGHDAPGAIGPLSKPSRRLGEGGAARWGIDSAPVRRRGEGDLVRGDANDRAIAEVQGFEFVRVSAAPYGLGEKERETDPELGSRYARERMQVDVVGNWLCKKLPDRSAESPQAAESNLPLPSTSKARVAFAPSSRVENRCHGNHAGTGFDTGAVPLGGEP